MAFGLFNKDMGIDLGTANTLVYVRGRGIVINEPSVVAMNISGSRRAILAVGEEAKEMIGRTPGSIIAVRPLKDGVIADFDVAEIMLKYFIRKALNTSFRIGVAPRTVICVPCGVTELEKRAVEDAARSAGVREALLLEEPMAAAIGAGLPVNEPRGSMIVDIGGGTSEFAVVSMGGIVASRSLRVGGNHLDDAIISYIKKRYNMMVGERTAEKVKIKLGTAYLVDEEIQDMDVRGRDLVFGLPTNIRITSEQVHEAIREPISSILDAAKQTLENTPPELASDILDRGIVLSGGGSQLHGLADLMRESMKVPVMNCENPQDVVALGAGLALEDYASMRRTAMVPRSEMM